MQHALPSESDYHCRYCFDVYQTPVFLKCDHSICLSCAQNLLDTEVLKSLRQPAPVAAVVAGGDAHPVEQEYNVHCPHCHDVTTLTRSHGVSGLQVNETLKAAIERYLRDKDQVPLCGNDCGKTSTLECLRCQAPFCDECYQSLHSKTAFKSHQPLMLGELEVTVPLQCPRHSKDLELYCHTCQTIICLVCYSFGDHQGHQTQPLGEHAHTCRHRLLSSLLEVSARGAVAQKAHDDAQAAIADVNKAHEALDANVESVCAQLTEAIAQRKAALLRKSNMIRNTKVARLTAQAAAFSNQPNLFSKINRTFTEISNSKSSLVLVTSVTDLERVSQRLSQETLQLEPCEDASLVERLDPTSLVRSLSAFGVIATPLEVKIATEARQAVAAPTPAPAPAPAAAAPAAQKPAATPAKAPATTPAKAPATTPAKAPATQQKSPAPVAAKPAPKTPTAAAPKVAAKPAATTGATPPTISVSAAAPAASAGPASPLSASALAAVGVDPADAEAKRTRYKQLLAQPLLFAGISEASQITAHASRFDAHSAMQLTDKTPLVKVLHFDNMKDGWVAFDCKAPTYMVRVRVFNGKDTKWDVQYSDSGADASWKTCSRIELTTSEWNVASWRPVGAHRFWRLVCVENKGSNWYEKFEWFSVPNDVMADMKKLMEAVQAAGVSVAVTPKAAQPAARPQSARSPVSPQK